MRVDSREPRRRWTGAVAVGPAGTPIYRLPLVIDRIT